MSNANCKGIISVDPCHESYHLLDAGDNEAHQEGREERRDDESHSPQVKLIIQSILICISAELVRR